MDLLTYKEAAEELRCSEKTVWNMANKYKTLPVVTVGRRLKKISREAIENYKRQFCGV